MAYWMNIQECRPRNKAVAETKAAMPSVFLTACAIVLILKQGDYDKGRIRYYSASDHRHYTHTRPAFFA